VLVPQYFKIQSAQLSWSICAVSSQRFAFYTQADELIVQQSDGVYGHRCTSSNCSRPIFYDATLAL